MFLRKHWVVLPHAIFMAVLVALPLILFPFLAKDQYRGINIAHFGSDQHFYLSRARDVLDGYGLGNSLLRDGKDGPDPYFTWNERVLLTPYHWFGVGERMNVATLYTVMNFVGIFLLVILIYTLTYQLCGHRSLAIVSALFVIGGSSFVFYRTIFDGNMNVYGRAMSPYLSSIALFLYFNFLVQSLARPRLRTVALATLTFGALFYVYLFAWVYALTFTVLLFAIYLLRRDWSRAKFVAIITGVGIMLGSYNLFFLIRSLFDDASKPLRYFHYMERTHAPMFSLVGLVLIVLFLLFWRKYRNDERQPLFLALILAGWTVVNQQIITGLRLQPGHFYWYFIVPVGILLTLWMSWRWIEQRSWKSILCFLLIVIVYMNTAVSQYRATWRTMPYKLAEQRFQPILSEMQKDREPSVILASSYEKAFLYTIYTPHDLFWHGAATYYHPEAGRMKEALSIFLLLHREARKDPVAFLTNAMNEPVLSVEAFLYQSLEGFTSGLNYPDYNRQLQNPSQTLLVHRKKLIKELTDIVQKMKEDPRQIQELFNRSGVEYVVWDEAADPKWDVSIFPSLQKIRSFQDLHLYRFESS